MTELSENSLYSSVESALRSMNCDITAAECHGILCGMLCGVRQFDASVWLSHTMGYNDDVSLSDLSSNHVLSQLLEQTVTGFSADDFSLQVLLPHDDRGLAVRVEALGSWCRGFLSGFGVTDLPDTDQLSEDSQNFLRDLRDIGRIDSAIPGDEADEADEADEYALMEVCEYTRIGALLLHDETRFIVQADHDGGTIH